MFSRDRLISIPDREALIELYHSLPEERIKRFYNLHYMIKKDISLDDVPDILREEGMSLYAAYFLMMEKDSFTRMHSDNDDVITGTSITLLETENLQGGEIIVMEPHYKKDIEVTPEVTNRYTEGDYKAGDSIIPIVVNQAVGETIKYGPSVLHSVSKVESGTRLVLVTWYKNEENKI